MRRLLVAAVAIAALLGSVITAYAAIRVTTYVAKPLHIHLGSRPHCTSLRYKLSTRAEDVDLKIINRVGREVWEVDRHTGLSAGVVHAFRWCGQREGGGTVTPNRTYRWRVKADQAGTDAEGASRWRAVYVLR